MITKIIDSIDNGTDLLIDKSRDMGATWIILATFFCYWLLGADNHFLVCSRKEEFVARKGDHKALFSKLLYLYKKLPGWLKPEIASTHMHLLNVGNQSCLDGEATSSDIGAGDRRKAIMVDELARVDPAIATGIEETLTDVSNCIIYNSTHSPKHGKSHPYARLRYSNRVSVIILPWWEHPEKNHGLYRSSDLDEVEIHDIPFYRDTYGGGFHHVQPKEKIKASDYEKEVVFDEKVKHSLFVADGSGKWRSPWYDNECRRRSSRDVATNLDMNPIGAGDCVFDLEVIRSQLLTFARDPDYVGEIVFDYLDQTKIARARFRPRCGQMRLKWWGELIKDYGGDLRPDQRHNYIVGCDISLGTGMSNSVNSIFDVNLCRKVGSFCSPNLAPYAFADHTVALCKWLGGASCQPFLIWEANGPGGTYGRRIYDLGYPFVYHRRAEKVDHRPARGKEKGFHSTGDSKMDLIFRYREALALASRKDPQRGRFENPDAKSLHEAENYIFMPSGKSIGPSQMLEDEGGALATHGDCVIADALCELARQDQPRALSEKNLNPRPNTIGYRIRQQQMETTTNIYRRWYD